MAFVIALALAFAKTLVVGLVSRFGSGQFIADWKARGAGVFVPIGFAAERYSYGGPPTMETFGRLTAALGSLIAVIILWRLFLSVQRDDAFA